MVARLNSSSISGLDAQTIEVEVHTKLGQKKFTIIGLGDNAVKEARDRVMQAIRHLGYKVPNVVLVNLAPAEIRKEGSSFDLAIAIGILISSGQLQIKNPADTYFFGELALDGRIKPLRGILSLVISAMQSGAKRAVVPFENFAEASLVKGIELIPISSLTSLINYFLKNELEIFTVPLAKNNNENINRNFISDVSGQNQAKRAMLIAASGGHNLLMIGPPGCGKSMLAGRFSNLLPDLSEEESMQVVKIHSIAGLSTEPYISGKRPFRSPHHIVSDVGLIGGGNIPKPGEISLAHKGVLFLDEFPEFRRSALESLRAPLESGSVQITRARASFVFPANFQLIAAMNPCPCGRLGAKNLVCNCGSSEIKKYLKKLSEPILDRIDLHTDLDAVPFSEMQFGVKGNIDDSELILKVINARKLQYKRRGKLNTDLQIKEVNNLIKIESQAMELMEKASKQVALSARSIIRVIRVAMTIADLEESDRIESVHVAEALNFRKLERLRQYVNGN